VIGDHLCPRTRGEADHEGMTRVRMEGAYDIGARQYVGVVHEGSIEASVIRAAAIDDAIARYSDHAAAAAKRNRRPITVACSTAG
jgi:hypothetical protein